MAVHRGTTVERFVFDDTGRLQVRMDSTGDRAVHYDVTHYDLTTGEVYEVDALQERVLQARRPLGALGWVSTYHAVKGTTNVEQYETDPLANQVSWHSLSQGATSADAPPSEPEDATNNYQAHTGRLLTSSAAGIAYEYSIYDRTGNQTYHYSFKPVTTAYEDQNSNKVVAQLRDESALYYGADDKLHVADRRTCLYFPATTSTYQCDTTKPTAYENRAAFEEYRYDALGRRVLVRTRSEYDCQLNCLSTLRRMVWDGDQLLYEISAPGASGTTAAQMEADTGLAVPFFLNAQHTAVAGWFPYGRVMYEHGGGIDAPLGVVRMEFSDVLHDPQVIFPFHTWRGSYDGGVTQGQCAYYTTNGTQLAPAPDSTPTEGDTQYRVHANSGYGSTAEHCVTVDWPAAFMLSARQLRRGYAGPDSWMGSLLFESRDASGLYYRRNRYYDSEKQRFTQEDPIGIAGGINVYGFANGDPITFTDAFGLKTDDCCDEDITQPTVAEIANQAIKDAIETAADKALTITQKVLDVVTPLPDYVRGAFGVDPWTGHKVSTGGRIWASGMVALSVIPGEGGEADAVKLWSKSTFRSEAESIAYHLGKHGEGKSLVEYTADARRFYLRNRRLARPIQLNTGEWGLKIAGTAGEAGGIYTRAGQIVSFWYR